MVGALRAVGAKDMDPAQLKRILEAKDISSFFNVKGNKMASPDGLYLARVEYDDAVVRHPADE
jgi:tRNA U38,U39,U40 pseudouridine synthase TruA